MDKKYFAFISYQRKDEKLAEWLRRKLEGYHLPAKIKRENRALPKALRPIFRDSLELSGGFLAQEIEKALNDSRYLIVVCSPNSAASPWVNKEIQSFIDQGREDCIIPYIIAGTPFSGDEATECFPPALRSLQGEKEILGININELGRDASVIKVVARMFGLSFDTLWQRRNREQRRKRIAWAFVAVLLILISFFVSGYFFKVNREIEQKNREILQQSMEIEEKSDEISRKNIEVTQKNEEIAGQYREIEQKNREITERNKEILRGRDRLLISQSKYLVTEAKKEYERGDVAKALRLALYALPKDLKNPDRPYVMEAEAMLRKCRLSIEQLESDYFKTTIIKHTSGINSAFLSPDGKYILTASSDYTARVSDVITGQQIFSPLKHNDIINYAVFSPCGKYIATASSDHTARIWDAKTGVPLTQPLMHADNVNSVNFSPDGKYIVTASLDKTARIWDVKTGKQVVETFTHDKWLDYSEFSPCGNSVLTMCNGDFVQIWDIATAKPVKEVLLHEKFVNSHIISPDEKYLLINGSDSVVNIWDITQDNELVASLKHKEHVYAADISPDGKTVITATYDKIFVWDIKTGELLAEPLMFDGIDKLQYSSCGKYIIASSSSKRQVWNADTKANITDKVSLLPREYYEPIFYSAGNEATVISQTADEGVRIKLAEDEYIQHFVHSQCGNYIAVVYNDHSEHKYAVRVFSVKTGKPITEPLFNERGINSITFSPNGKLLFISYDNNDTYIQNLENGEIVEKPLKAKCIDFSKDGKYFAFITEYKYNKYLIVFNASKIEQINEPIKCSSNTDFLAFNPDAVSVAVVSNNVIDFYNINTGEYAAESIKYDNRITSVAFSPCGKRLTTTSLDRYAMVWDIASNKCLWQMEFGYSVHSAHFSPDGKFIITSSIGSPDICIWDSSTHKIVWEISNGTSASHATFSPDGKSVYAALNQDIYILPFQPLQEIIDKYRNDPEHDWSLSQEEKDEYSLE